MLRLEHQVIGVDFVRGEDAVIADDIRPVDFTHHLVSDLIPVDGITQFVVPVTIADGIVEGIADAVAEVVLVDGIGYCGLDVIGLDEVEVVSPVGEPHHHALGDERVDVLLERLVTRGDGDLVHRQHLVETSDLVLEMLETHLGIRLRSGREHLGEVADEATDCGEHICVVYVGLVVVMHPVLLA